MSLDNLARPAVIELERRGLLPPAETNLQKMTIASLMGARGTQPNTEEVETDQHRYERLSREDDDSLKRSLEWNNLDGPPSYRLLAERGQIEKEIVRNDLLKKFSRLREDHFSQLEKEWGADGVRLHHETFDKFQELFIRLFSAAALAALAKEPAPEDVASARPFLNDFAFRSDALKILARGATENDLSDFIGIATSSFGEDRQLALNTVKRIAPDKLAAARTLVALDVRDMSHAALSLVRELEDQQALPFLKELLLDEHDGIRLAALDQIRKRLDNAGLVEVLARYTNGRYFYNVVAWIDRLVYAPTPILNYYRSEFETKLKAQAW